MHDAIGETVIKIQKRLKILGYDSKIFVEKPIPQTSKIGIKYTEYKPNNSDLIIYHHSIGSELSDFVSDLKVPKVVCFHNITKPHFFEKYNKTLSLEMEKGLSELQKLVKKFQYVMGSSDYTKQELSKLGFKNILPFNYFIDLERFNDLKLNSKIIKKYEKTTNVIFVGRKVPNKKIEDLLKVFAYFKIFNPNSKLFLLGGSWSVESYNEELSQWMEILHLNNNDVIFIDTLTDEDLATYYKISDIFLCLSEHEGFCIPLVEAMFFKIPIVAFNSTSIPSTLGNSGILLNHKKYPEIAEILHIITTNDEIKRRILEGQNERVKHFTNEKAEKILNDNIEFLLKKL